MSWLYNHTTLYKNKYDNIGRPATIHDVLFTDFAIPAEGNDYTDLDQGIKLRTMHPDDENYEEVKDEIKSKVQLFSPAACLVTRERDNVTVKCRTGILQVDFDYSAIKDYYIEELKAAVFDLPFVAYVGISISGHGFYALIQYAEPERLTDYYYHVYAVFEEYGIKPDISKGRNVQDLRYLSYDPSPLWRDEPEILHVTHFKLPKSKQKKVSNSNHTARISGSNALVIASINKILQADIGQRWPTVQNAAYTLGGLQDRNNLEMIYQAIDSNGNFSGREEKYKKCALDCFEAGMLKPLPVK